MRLRRAGAAEARPSCGHQAWQCGTLQWLVWPSRRSQILGPQAGALRDPGEHAGPDLLVVVKGEHDVGLPRSERVLDRNRTGGVTTQPILGRAASTRRERILGQPFTQG
jgi:hypothetical protein